MNILKNIRQKIADRFAYLEQKRAIKLQTQRIIEKHRLNDPVECQKIIDQYTLMQTNKHAFGRKEKERIKDKIKFMIHYKLIKVVE